MTRSDWGSAKGYVKVWGMPRNGFTQQQHKARAGWQQGPGVALQKPRAVVFSSGNCEGWLVVLGRARGWKACACWAGGILLDSTH